MCEATYDYSMHARCFYVHRHEMPQVHGTRRPNRGEDAYVASSSQTSDYDVRREMGRCFNQP
jgi:hypothetical protein